MEHTFSSLGRLYLPFNLFSSIRRPACVLFTLAQTYPMGVLSLYLSLCLSPLYLLCLKEQVSLCCSIVSLTILLAPLLCKLCRFCAVITECVTETWCPHIVYTVKVLYNAHANPHQQFSDTL